MEYTPQSSSRWRLVLSNAVWPSPSPQLRPNHREVSITSPSSQPLSPPETAISPSVHCLSQRYPLPPLLRGPRKPPSHGDRTRRGVIARSPPCSMPATLHTALATLLLVSVPLASASNAPFPPPPRSPSRSTWSSKVLISTLPPPMLVSRSSARIPSIPPSTPFSAARFCLPAMLQKRVIGRDVSFPLPVHSVSCEASTRSLPLLSPATILLLASNMFFLPAKASSLYRLPAREDPA